MSSPRNTPIQQRPTGGSGSRTTWIIGGVIAAIVLIAGIVAIVSTSGGDDDTDKAAVVTEPTSGASEAEATAPVETDAAVSPVSPDTDVAATDAPAAGGGSLSQTQAVTVSGTPLPALGDDEAVGATAPTITGQSFDGTPITIGPGKATLIVFLAHWCPHCQREVPVLVEWQAGGGAPEGLDVIGVATATTDQRDNYPPSDWLAAEAWPWPVMADSAESEAAIAMGVDAFPFFVLLDADGTVVARQSGEIDPANLDDLIATALA